eukprot:207487_1
MSSVTIKYGKKKHKKVAIKSTDSFDDIQAIIFSLTQVTPERQKIIVRGKKLENDSDVEKLIKNGALITVMGTNVNNSMTSDSSSNVNIKFLDDMTVAERQKVWAELPPGLHNLGNTCYLNSSVQCLKSIDELREYLKEKSAIANTDNTNNNNNSMVSKLGELMFKLDTNSETVVPQQFVQYFRSAFPRFASRNEHGMWEQQDADEAYTEIINSLRTDTNIVNDLFEGQFETNTICTESPEEPQTIANEKFIKLQCFIDINTRHINDGLKKGFTENMEKRSDKLDRNALWTKTKLISKLPKYIPIQLVRFFWKQKTQKNAKILRKVIFPQKLDIYEFCDAKLKKNVEKYRKLKLEKEDKEREEKQSVSVSQDENKENKENAMDVDEEDVNRANNENEQFFTGYYELCAIVTHKGRSANSGHYIGYSKDSARNKWLKYDDEDVTEIKPEEVKQLYGGGDHQMAFLCFYRRIEPVVIR